MSDPAQGRDPLLAEALLELSPNGILVTGPDGRLAVVNPAVHAILPVVPDAVGRPPLEAVPVGT